MCLPWALGAVLLVCAAVGLAVVGMLAWLMAAINYAQARGME